jgi:hypothetical protein
MLYCSLAQTHSCTASSIINCSFLQLLRSRSYNSLRAAWMLLQLKTGFACPPLAQDATCLSFLAHLNRTETVFIENSQTRFRVLFTNKSPTCRFLCLGFHSSDQLKTDYLHCVHLCNQKAATQIHTCFAFTGRKTLYGIF